MIGRGTVKDFIKPSETNPYQMVIDRSLINDAKGEEVDLNRPAAVIRGRAMQSGFG